MSNLEKNVNPREKSETSKKDESSRKKSNFEKCQTSKKAKLRNKK